MTFNEVTAILGEPEQFSFGCGPSSPTSIYEWSSLNRRPFVVGFPQDRVVYAYRVRDEESVWTKVCDWLGL
jgi:hypothetical protein